MASGERQHVYVLEKCTAESSRVTTLRYCTCGTLAGAQRVAERLAEVPLTWEAAACGRWVDVINHELSYIITEEEVFD